LNKPGVVQRIPLHFLFFRVEVFHGFKINQGIDSLERTDDRVEGRQNGGQEGAKIKKT
jgi:hypothetical protein